MGKTSLVRALMSSSFTCEPIDLEDRTVGIDRYEVQLQALSLQNAKKTTFVSRKGAPARDQSFYSRDRPFLHPQLITVRSTQVPAAPLISSLTESTDLP